MGDSSCCCCCCCCCNSTPYRKRVAEAIKKRGHEYDAAVTAMQDVLQRHATVSGHTVGKMATDLIAETEFGMAAGASAPSLATTTKQPAATDELSPASGLYGELLQAAGGSAEFVHDFVYDIKCNEEAATLGYATNDVAFASALNRSAGSSDPRSRHQREPDWLPAAPAKDPEFRNSGKKTLDVLPRSLWGCRSVVLPDKSDRELYLDMRLQKREHDIVYSEWKHPEAQAREAWIATHNLVAYSELLPFILRAVYCDVRKDKFVALCRFMGAPLVDRTETLLGPLVLKVVHPIPRRNPDFSTPLDQIMLARALSLLQMSKQQGKRLNVLWSGGLDTTAMVVAFLKVTVVDPLERKRIRIRYRSDSVDENPLFWKNHVQPNFECLLISDHVRDILYDGSTSDQIIVTGDPCDMLFGTFMMADSFRPRYDVTNERYNPMHGRLDDAWQDVLPQCLHAKGLLLSVRPAPPELVLEASQEWVQWMTPFMDKAPIKVVSTFDALWWMAYALKYQHDLLRIFYNSPQREVPDSVIKRVVNFYESEPFHQWSFAFHHLKMANHHVWTTYKQPLKDFMREFADHEYLTHKIKVVSTRNSFGTELGYDTSWRSIQFGKYSISRYKFQSAYGDGQQFLRREYRQQYQQDRPVAPTDKELGLYCASTYIYMGSMPGHYGHGE